MTVAFVAIGVSFFVGFPNLRLPRRTQRGDFVTIEPIFLNAVR